MAKRVQIVLLVLFVLIGIRLLLIYRSRHQPVLSAKTAAPAPALTNDDYVVPAQVHAYDLKSAKDALDGKSVWVKAGYGIYYFPFASGRVDFKHPVGLLPPLQKLDIERVIDVTDPTAKAQEVAPGVKVRPEEVMVIFHPAGETKTYAAQIGSNKGGDYTLFINDTFYIEDPRTLYHWPSDVWAAIDQHQAKTGMNELQVSMALGGGIDQVGGQYGNRTLQYDNNGHPVKVTFEHNRAVDVHNVSGS